MRRSPPPKRRKRLPAISRHRSAERGLRAAVVAVVRQRDNDRCAGIGLIEDHVCAGPLDVHEVIPRSVWRAGYLEPANCVVVCRSAHDWIGGHPVTAAKLGLHGFSFQRPDMHHG